MYRVTKLDIALIGSYFFLLLGVLLFSKGFLTVRPLSETKNTEASPAKLLFPNKHQSNNAGWLAAPFQSRKKKFVILILDALRIDFVLPPKTHCKTAYCGRLKVFHELAQQDPNLAKLFRFVADPPTATTQRIPGIVGGTFPSFVDAFSSFSGQTLFADNVIYQMLLKPLFKKFHFVGDDTWLHLYPFIMERSKGKVKGYHSFSLFDLHTVDNAIKDQLFPTLEANDFDVVLAHFLGLDHCGHKFGPLHEDCGKKLDELDGVIRKVIEQIGDETVLLVMGDHGMTEEGDHGGSAPKEVSSTLFIYTKKDSPATDNETLSQQFWADFNANIRLIRKDSSQTEDFFKEDYDSFPLTGSVHQIDFCPTLSMLAEIPIPFGNVGSMIPEIFQMSGSFGFSTLLWLLEAVRLNAHQMRAYFESFNHGDFSSPEFLKIKELFDKAERQTFAFTNHEALSESIVSEAFFNYFKFIHEGMTYCKAIWARYNYRLIFAGLAIMIVSLCLLVATILQSQTLLISDLFFVPVVLVQFIGKATNSFIIFEDQNIVFLLNSTLIIKLLTSSESYLSSSKYLYGALIARLIVNFRSCRDEQGKLCYSLNHRAIHVGSFWGSLGICIAVTNFAFVLHSLKQSSKSSKFIPKALVLLLSLVYQMYGWIHEVYSLNELILQIYLPRLLFGFSFLGISYTLVEGMPGEFLFFLATFIATVLRPFAAWSLINVGANLFRTFKPSSNNALFKAVYYYFFSFLLFFSTGHQATISGIHWEAGFIGFPELNQVRAFCLLLLNTFGGPIIAFSSLIADDLKASKYFLLISAFEMVFVSCFTSTFLQHLMLPNVFIPRYLMQAALTLIYFIIFLVYILIRE